MGQVINSSRREREDDDHEALEPAAKRVKTEDGDNGVAEDFIDADTDPIAVAPISLEADQSKPKYIVEDLLPPSRSLLSSQDLYERPADRVNFTMEADVGITEYVGRDVPPIQGIIKQRCSYEIMYDTPYRVLSPYFQIHRLFGF
jgi:tRNA pseudouridine13 synthase